jgi:hypothetical protein
MRQRFSGASVQRVIDRSRACVPEHAHDRPVLSLFAMGAYANRTEAGERLLCGPSAVFYRAGTHPGWDPPTNASRAKVRSRRRRAFVSSAWPACCERRMHRWL